MNSRPCPVSHVKARAKIGKEWACEMRKKSPAPLRLRPCRAAGVAAAPGASAQEAATGTENSLRATPAPEEFGVDTLDPGSDSTLCGQSPAWQQRAQRNQVWCHSTEQ